MSRERHDPHTAPVEQTPSDRAPWQPPTVTRIPLSRTLNSSGGSSDGPTVTPP